MTHQIASGSILARPGRPGRLALAALVVFLPALLGVTGCKSISDRSIESVGFSEVQRQFLKKDGSVLFVDPRPREEYTAGHIPGAVHLRTTDVDLKDPDPSLGNYKMLIVYGNNPGSGIAKAMVKQLLTADFKRARWFQGGMDAWREAGMPVDTGAPSQ